MSKGWRFGLYRRLCKKFLDNTRFTILTYISYFVYGFSVFHTVRLQPLHAACSFRETHLSTSAAIAFIYFRSLHDILFSHTFAPSPRYMALHGYAAPHAILWFSRECDFTLYNIDISIYDYMRAMIFFIIRRIKLFQGRRYAGFMPIIHALLQMGFAAQAAMLLSTTFHGSRFSAFKVYYDSLWDDCFLRCASPYIQHTGFQMLRAVSCISRILSFNAFHDYALAQRFMFSPPAAFGIIGDGEHTSFTARCLLFSFYEISDISIFIYTLIIMHMYRRHFTAFTATISLPKSMIGIFVWFLFASPTAFYIFQHWLYRGQKPRPSMPRQPPPM